MKKLLSSLGLAAISVSAITSSVVLTNNEKNINIRSLDVEGQDISVGNNGIRGMDKARYMTFEPKSLGDTYIASAVLSILNEKGISARWEDKMFDVTLTNMKDGKPVTQEQTSSGLIGANTLWMQVNIKTNEVSEAQGLIGEMHFTYYMNFPPLDLNDSILTNFILFEDHSYDWYSANDLQGIIMQADVWIYEQIMRTHGSDILYDTPYSQDRIDHHTSRPIYIEETSQLFTQDMLDNMLNGEKINLKFQYFPNEKGEKTGIIGSTIVHITFEKGKMH
ncbi:hypothetical protein [Spiroplasma endosymbiont of Othius punctulatus]|uniref:hypothetical protein n=1 Tax=Spiroplasma endosymbiont of Othius punctulatus TaxID=3066289 RepID=UPI0030CC3709